MIQCPIGISERAEPSCLEPTPGRYFAWTLSALVFGCQTPASDATAQPPEAVRLERPNSMLEDCVALERPIVFTSTRGNFTQRADLFLMDGRGDQVMRLARDDIDLAAPRWSPDGQDIVFRRRRLADDLVDNWTSLALVAADGTSSVTLTREWKQLTPGEGVSDAPSWSADGERIAYSAANGSDYLRIWAVSRWGGSPELLLPDVPGSHFGPSWSPRDPLRLAYVAVTDGQSDVWIADVSEPSRAVNITRGRLPWSRSLRWSPDGERLALVSEEPAPDAGLGDSEVYLIDLRDDNSLYQVTENDSLDEHTTWSGDGASLLVASNRPRPALSAFMVERQLALWRVPIDNPDASVRLTGDGQNDGAPDWYQGSACAER